MKIDMVENGRMNICISVVMRVTLKDGTFHEVSQTKCTLTTLCRIERKPCNFVQDIGVGFMENCRSKAIGIQKVRTVQIDKNEVWQSLISFIYKRLKRKRSPMRRSAPFDILEVSWVIVFMTRYT